MSRKRSKPKPAKIIEFHQLKMAAGGSGTSGGGSGGGANSISLMGMLVRQRQGDSSDTSASDVSSTSERADG